MIEVEVVGDSKLDREEMRKALQKAVRKRRDKGWSLVSTASRGGGIYLIFEKEKP